MRPDISDVEYHNLFLSEIRTLRFSIDELGKMLESRLDVIAKYVCDNELTKSEIKESKQQFNDTIEAYDMAIKAISEGLKKKLEDSLNIFEQNTEKKSIAEKLNLKRKNYNDENSE